MFIKISESEKYVGEEVEIKGWLYNKRSSGSVAFFEIRDGSGFIQAVIAKNNVSDEIWEKVESLTQESSLRLVGEITKHPKKEAVFELQAQDLEIINLAETYPISLKEHGPEFLLDNRHLWIRTPTQWAILRVRDTVIRAINEYLHLNDFLKLDSPVFTPSACEGTTTLFPVPYFELGSAYLSQSGQLYLEAAIASVGRCYDFGPVFRAEKSKTKRHLTEFWMMDAEASFVGHKENMDIQEGLIKHIVAKVLEENKKELEILERNIEPLKKIVENPFKRLSYRETIEELQSLGSDIKQGEDLGNDDEALLTGNSDVPVFVERWPSEIKPFYMKRDSENENLVLNNDLIATEGGGEIIGGSEREDDYDILLQRIRKEGLPEKDYEWYLDLRKFGSVPHSGFGVGLERVVRWVTGAKHIRECIPFPRLINRMTP